MNINSKFKLEKSSKIYSGVFDQKNKIICLPVTSDSSVHFYKLGEKRPFSIVKLKNCKPDLAHCINENQFLIGCQDSSQPVIISKDKILKYVKTYSDDFFATSIKQSKEGKIFIGNLNGTPMIFDGNTSYKINLQIDSSYDCIWISEEYLIVSCYRDD